VSETLPGIRITPIVAEITGDFFIPGETSRARNERVRSRLIAKAEEDARSNGPLLQRLREFTFGRIFAGREMRFVPVDPGQFSELIVLFSHTVSSHGSEECLAVLLQHDRIIDWRHHAEKGRTASLTLVWEDFDKDGTDELGIEVHPGIAARGEFDRKLGNDPRIWLDVYKIERTGFRS